MPTFTSSPIVILSNPQMGENIGATSRAMSNFGLYELRLVSPRDGWPNPKAYELAANGSFILDNVKVFEDLNSAISDINLLYGTASSDRFLIKDTISPKEIKLGEGAQKTGLLFGCERTGLTNDELALCDCIIKIPTSAKNPSLNLAQAVLIIAYELSLIPVKQKALPPRASKQDVMLMLSFLETSLHEAGFFKSLEMRPTMMRNIYNMFLKTNLNEQDVRTLYGIFKALKG